MQYCPACDARDPRLHYADEWAKFHPSLWGTLSQVQQRRLLSGSPTNPDDSTEGAQGDKENANG